MSRLARAPATHANGAQRTPGSVTQQNGVSSSAPMAMIPSVSEVVAPLWDREPGYGAPYAGGHPYAWGGAAEPYGSCGGGGGGGVTKSGPDGCAAGPEGDTNGLSSESARYGWCVNGMVSSG